MKFLRWLWNCALVLNIGFAALDVFAQAPVNCPTGALNYTAATRSYTCANPIGPAAGGTGVANNAAATLTRSGNHALTLTTSGTTNVTLPTAGTLSITVASGTSALGTSQINSGACASAVTTTATGTATTDVIQATFNADPTSTTGYSASVNGMLTIIAYPTTNNVNFKVCNNTGAAITPGAVTLNWRVVR